MKCGANSPSVSSKDKVQIDCTAPRAFLNHPSFAEEKGMTMLEQLLGLERLAEEYEYAKVAKEDISDNTKLSVLLRVMPAAVRQHLQLQMTEDTSYKEAREKMLAYERTTTLWGTQAIYKELAITKDHDKNDEVTPMDVDRVKGKEKGKGKVKDKGGKSKGKQKGKGYGERKRGQGQRHQRKGQRCISRHLQALWWQGSLEQGVPNEDAETGQ